MSVVMIKFKNKLTGDDMWVASDRVEEYKAAGHKLAADLGTRPKAPEPVKAEEVETPAPVEATKKKVIRKKR